MHNPGRLKSFNSKIAETPSISDQAADAFLLLLAGTDTTAHTLVVAVFNILYKPAILARLRDELQKAMLQPGSQLKWADLVKLPYLV